MSEPLTRHQIVEYSEKEPFVLINIRNNCAGPTEQLLNHWHEELEIAYIVKGSSRHYIDGKCTTALAGRVVVVNCGCVHNIIVDEIPDGEKTLRCIVILINKEFVEEIFPEYRSVVFTNEAEKTSAEIVDIITKLSLYSEKKDRTAHDYLYARGLLTLLLYYLCEKGTCKRGEVSEVNYQKNIERLRGVLQYVENHYSERIIQSKVAEKFYFSKEYFSRFFKQCTGMTFTEHLSKYRLQKARMNLLETNASILEIALNNGFSDERTFINAFKKVYNKTPLQYRKSINIKNQR